MQHAPRVVLAAFAALAAAVCLSPRAAAVEFPPITDEERALKAVAGEPNAPAVVLSKNAEFWLMDLSRQDVSSRLVSRVRIKVLTEQGKGMGEVEIPHSSFVRLNRLEGRTVLPDGRVLPLPKEARFERRLSRSEKRFVTSVAFPSVEVGAILDYEVELRFDTFYYLEPWYLSEEIPVRRAEIVYHVPAEMGVQAWSRDPFKAGLRTETSRVAGGGSKVRVWAEKLPPIADEPFGLPFEDLATQTLLLPAVYADEVLHYPLMKDWASTSDLILKEQYDKARRKDGAAQRKARALAAKGTPREKATALYRFVRDEIANEDLEGVTLRDGATVDGVLARGSGDSAEKALLLEQMLRAVGVKAQPVWAAERSRGTIDPQIANPGWFHRVLVAADLGGERVFLDPSDRALGFGQLDPDLEGTAALIPDTKKPEGLTLPATPFDHNRRRATVDLALDDAGVVSGTGTLLLTGHHAWSRIGWLESREQELEAWKEWLQESFAEFQVSEVKVEESVEDRTVRLTWAMAQRAEESLGDEVSLKPSAPLGPTQQPFALPAASRRSPVLFSFADRDEVELKLRWPAGWSLDVRPQPVRHDGGLGLLEATLEVDAAGHALTYRRAVEIRERQATSREQYEAVRSLFAAVEKSDAQALVLVRR